MVRDCFGQEIHSGDIIAYAANNNWLKIYLVREVREPALLVSSFEEEYDYDDFGTDDEQVFMGVSEIKTRVNNAESGAWVLRTFAVPFPPAVYRAYMEGAEAIRGRLMNGR